MKKWKFPLFCVWILICLLLNYGGQLLAGRLSMPIWLDSYGTVLCAYVTGPLCGAMVGLTSNLIFFVTDGVDWIYGLISILIAVIVGIAAHRKRMDDLFGIMTVGGIMALACTAACVPLNYFLNGGSTGNIWGDAVIGFLQELGLPDVLCLSIGQLYVEMLDKLLVMLLLYIALCIGRIPFIRKNVQDIKIIRRKKNSSAEKAAKTLTLLLAAGLCAAAVPAAVRAETEKTSYNDYVQTIYSSTNGLPCGEANDIAQTNDGILWIGTYAGLYRYNGREFRWMDYESVRNVNTLYVDEEGRLWIGTNDNGLSIAINEQIVNVVDQSSGLPSNSVRDIVRSSDGYYYIGTTGSMQVLTMNYGLRQVNTLTEIYYADDLDADRDGHVAAVTSSGTLYLLAEGSVLSSRQMTDGKTVFKSCEFDTNGHLLAATTGNEIYEFDVSRGWFEDLGVISTGTLESIKDIDRLDTGELMITADNGVGVISPEGSFELINTNEFNNSIDKVMVDYQGNMWFTSSRLGLLRMAPSDFRDVYSTVGMDNRVVNTTARWQGVYYFGTDKGLDAVDLACRNRITNELTEQLEGSRIRCMMTDSDDHLWICTYNDGLLEVEPDGTQYRYTGLTSGFGNRARVVIQLSDGTILSAGDTGIIYIRDHQITNRILYSSGMIHSMILTLTELDNGIVLAGTDGNGIAVLQDGKAQRMLTRADGLSSEVILRTVRDPKNGGVFIVTSNGLCYLDEDGTIRKLDNFPYFNNYDIWIRGTDSLFVMSSAGIYVVDRNELLSGKAEISYALLDTRRGLNSSLTANSWTYFNQETGELFIACDTGAYVIDTARFSSDNKAYRMSVPAVRLDGTLHRMERGMPLTVSRGVNKLELYPEVVNYTIQDPNVGYMLEGFDKDWIIVPQNSLGTITYTNLKDGTYYFRLAVFDNNQENILAERSYEIIKEQELHDRPGFIVYLLTIPMFTVGWLTWLYFKRRNQRIERELAEANRRVEMGKQTVAAIARAVDAKDERTGGHSQRVAEYSRLIAKAWGMSKEECQEIEWAAKLHDIGKIAIPDAILNKDGRLTDDEYARMKSHTVEGAKILKDFTLLKHVTEGAEYHHERPDGKGYPKGLKGDEIPIYARIIGVADAFDAMTATRVYRKQMDFGYVLGELEKGRGSQFDPKFVDILLNLIHTKEIDINKMYGISVEEKPQEKPAEDSGKPAEKTPEQPAEETGQPAEAPQGKEA